MEDACFLVVVSDRDGFVGAFTDLSAAKKALYPFREVVSFIYTLWPIEKPAGLGAPAWMLPYLANDVIAYASTNKTAVEEAQAALLRLELVPPDRVDFWESAVGVVSPTARRRLDALFVSPDSVKKDIKIVEDFLAFAGQAAEKITIGKKINILDFVQPRDS